MCRNIRTLFPFEPPATDAEIRAAALQFVRKISGTTKPSKANQAACDLAVEEIFAASRRLLDGMISAGPKKDRVIEAQKAKERSKLRFSKSPRVPAPLL
jgi:hypothetical protein